MRPAPTILVPPWTLTVRVLFNSVTWRAFPLVLGTPIVLVGAWVGYLATWRDGLVVATGGLAGLAVLWAVACLVIDLAGGLQVAYLMTSEGIHFASGWGARAAARGAAGAGMLAGSMGTVGAALLARAEQEASLEWREVRRFRIVERARYVEVKAGFFSKPIGIYCTQENFPVVREVVRSRAPS